MDYSFSLADTSHEIQISETSLIVPFWNCPNENEDAAAGILHCTQAGYWKWEDLSESLDQNNWWSLSLMLYPEYMHIHVIKKSISFRDSNLVIIEKKKEQESEQRGTCQDYIG